MSLLRIETQGIRGGQTHGRQVGYAFITVDDNKNQLWVDGFTGIGNTYKERNKSLINIQSDGKIIFSGTFDELVTILNNQKP